MDTLKIYTDGGSRGNPGPAAIGIVVKNTSGQIIKSDNQFIGNATNNEAEYRAVIFALQKVKSLLGGKRAKNAHIDILLDSELIGRQLTGQYKIEEEKLFPLFIKVWNLKMGFGSVSFQMIPREKNKEADKLVNKALDFSQKSLEIS